MCSILTATAASRSTETFYPLSSTRLHFSGESHTIYGGTVVISDYRPHQYNTPQGPRRKFARSKKDVIAHFAESFKGCQMERTQLSDECTKV